jgi:rubrerythrin/uncharacterized membrane protein
MRWKCTVCGYIHEGDAPPDTCPVCHAGKEKFEPVEDDAEKKPPRKWICTVCKYVHEGDSPPDTCPVCKKPWSAFVPFVEGEAPRSPQRAPGAAPSAPAKEAPAPVKADRWRCVVCNYVHGDQSPPDICPVCGAAKDQFAPETKSPKHHHRGLSGLIEKLHLHPVAAHFPNGTLPLAVLAWIAFLMFGEACFERTSFYLMLVAALAVPVTFFAGVSDARHRFGTTTTGVFPEKKLWSWVLLALGTANAGWRLSLGWAYVPMTGTEIAIYTGLLLASTAAAARLGMLGGKLVFGH